MSNRIQGTTRLLGLIGDPIKHSRSPHMHNSAFDYLGLDYVYLCIENGQGKFKETLDALKCINAIGGNITFPHKQTAINYVDKISEDAKLIGSVNTYKIDQETKQVSAYNTDGIGFVKSIEEYGLDIKNKKVVLAGVGGAGRAIAVNLAIKEVNELIIKELDKKLAEEVKDIIDSNFNNVKVRIIGDSEEELKSELKDSVLLINATPLGMKGFEDKCIITDKNTLHKDLFVYDIVYQPRMTKLLKYAEEIGCEFSNGINMMIWQGAVAFEIWTGKEMPQDYVRKELFE